MIPANPLDDLRDAVTGARGDWSLAGWGTLAGTALVTLGGYLPWLRHNPDHGGLVLSPQISPGFGLVDAFLLVPVGLLVVGLAVRGSTKGWARATGAVGLTAVLLPGLIAVRSYVERTPAFLPDVGLAATLLGGVLLLVAAGADLFASG